MRFQLGQKVAVGTVTGLTFGRTYRANLAQPDALHSWDRTFPGWSDGDKTVVMLEFFEPHMPFSFDEYKEILRTQYAVDSDLNEEWARALYATHVMPLKHMYLPEDAVQEA